MPIGEVQSGRPGPTPGDPTSGPAMPAPPMLRDRALDDLLEEVGVERGSPPFRVVALCVLCLAVAAGAALVWPDATRGGGGLVWVLVLVPVFLLSYHRGWQGAAVAAALAMLALVGVELAVTEWLGETVDWRLLGAGTAVVVATTLGAGAVSEGLHRQRKMAALLAYRDPMTGLANRRLIHEHTRKLMSLSDRRGTRVAVLSVELDELDAINEAYGHEAGDRALKEMASRLERHTRSGDTAARIGGNVFAAVIGDLESMDRCRDLAHRVGKALTLPLHVGDEPVEPGISLGAAIYPEHAGNFDQLLSHATTARRRARRRPGGTVAIFSPTPDDASSDERTFREDLGRALDGGQIVPHYQPVMTLREGVESGLEALVRWHHPDLGLLPAKEFVPVAERMGQVRRLDRQMLKLVADDLKRLLPESGYDWIAVNLSADTLQDATLADFVGNLLDEADVPGHRLVLEITEHTAIRNFHQVSDTMERLEEHGVRMSIDDFGTGHSSLAYLERIEADMVKLDMEFTHRLEDGERSRKLVSGIVDLANRLDIQTVAEGVETGEQHEALERIGADLAQGYHLGRPVAADVFL